MRSMRDKIVITCAVTGNLTKPEHTPYLPITPNRSPMPVWARGKPGQPWCISMCASLPPACPR